MATFFLAMDMYTLGRPLSRDVSACFISEVHVTNWGNWAAQQLQYQPTGRQNVSKMLYKTSQLSGCTRV